MIRCRIRINEGGPFEKTEVESSIRHINALGVFEKLTKADVQIIVGPWQGFWSYSHRSAPYEGCRWLLTNSGFSRDRGAAHIRAYAKLGISTYVGHARTWV